MAQKEVLSAQAALAQARADVEQAQAAADESLRKLQIFGLQPGAFDQEVLVRAPLPGKVLEISVAAGEYRNDTSAPLMTIADLSTVFMTADVPESQIRLIHKGERVEITLGAYPGEVFQGTVARLADTVDPQTRTIKVRAEMINRQERFRPEMFGEIRHEVRSREFPVVPSARSSKGTSGPSYTAKSPEAFLLQFLSRSENSMRSSVPVLSGLSAGDRVVTDGAMLLRGNR